MRCTTMVVAYFDSSLVRRRPNSLGEMRATMSVSRRLPDRAPAKLRRMRPPTFSPYSLTNSRKRSKRRIATAKRSS